MPSIRVTYIYIHIYINSRTCMHTGIQGKRVHRAATISNPHPLVAPQIYNARRKALKLEIWSVEGQYSGRAIIWTTMGRLQ
jgi:hypothetical protein